MTGTRIWRWYAIPGPGEKGSETWPADLLARGGGPTWLTGTYDPALNLLYWGTGNPNPDWDGESRPGDNLYTGSLVALDPDTGTLKWHYQFTPHDTHDWDANEIPVLADITLDGRTRSVVMMANRNGFFYVLDRANGSLLVAKPFANTSWANEIVASVWFSSWTSTPSLASIAWWRPSDQRRPGILRPVNSSTISTSPSRTM